MYLGRSPSSGQGRRLTTAPSLLPASNVVQGALLFRHGRVFAYAARLMGRAADLDLPICISPGLCTAQGWRHVCVLWAALAKYWNASAPVEVQNAGHETLPQNQQTGSHRLPRLLGCPKTAELEGGSRRPTKYSRTRQGSHHSNARQAARGLLGPSRSPVSRCMVKRFSSEPTSANIDLSSATFSIRR